MAHVRSHTLVPFRPTRVKSQQESGVFAPKATYSPPRVVSFRRLRGVDKPTSPRRITIDPQPAAAVIRQAVETALDSLDALDHESTEVARRFQQRAIGEAQVGLMRLFDLTQSVLRLADMTAAATGTTLAQFCEVEHLSAPIETDAVVTRLIREQLAEDWTAVATVLDQPFRAALDSWRGVFEALTPALGPDGTAA
jgi:hypothetical protein